MKKFIFRLPLVFLVLGAAIAAVASTGMFRKDSSKKATNYWVYISSANSGFADTAKYEIQSLNSPSDLGCSDENERPCVLTEAEGSKSDKAGLQSYLIGLGSDANIRNSAIVKKEFE